MIPTRARRLERTRRRLRRIPAELEQARATEQVLADQVEYLASVASDARTRGLVADDPQAPRDARDAENDLARHVALLEDTRREIRDLLDEQDALLDRLQQLGTGPGRREHP